MASTSACLVTFPVLTHIKFFFNFTDFRSQISEADWSHRFNWSSFWIWRCFSSLAPDSMVRSCKKV